MNKQRFIYNFIFAYFLSIFVYSQGSKSSSLNIDLNKIALVNQTDSYVTFPFHIGNLEPLIFEANISPSFIIRERKDSRLMGVLTAQIIIRMYNEESLPVRTPSYIPQITAYYSVGETLNKNVLFARIAHHSNGQDGDFYDENGDINLISGNFSTNFFELGFIHTSFSNKYNAAKFYKSSIEIHPKSWMSEDLHGLYSGVRWHNTFTAFKIPISKSDTEKKASISLKLEAMWMFDSVNNWGAFDRNRLNAGLTFYYHPKFLEDIGLFVQFYHGMDYYNIYFQHHLEVIRFGIMTDILRF